MKRITIIALCFVLAGCIMTGCRRNDMQDDIGSGNTTITTVPGETTIPLPTSRGGDNTVGSDPMDGNMGTDDPMSRGQFREPGL